MTPSTLEDFLALPWSPKVKAGIQATLSAAGTCVLVARQVPGSPPRAMVFPPRPNPLPPGTIALYRKGPGKALRDPYQAGLSRTAQALALVDAGATPTAAAQAVGVSPPAVFQALARRARAQRCPHCGQTTARAAYPVQPATLNDA